VIKIKFTFLFLFEPIGSLEQWQVCESMILANIAMSNSVYKQ